MTPGFWFFWGGPQRVAPAFVEVSRSLQPVLAHTGLRRRVPGAKLIEMIDNAKISIPLIRIGELARLTGLSVPHLRRLADEGLIPARRVGPRDHRRFSREQAVHRVQRLLIPTW